MAAAQAGSPQPLASDRILPARMQQYSELAVRWLQQYLQIDTTNPPGNEARATSWMKKILDEEGIENRVFEIAPGRANLWARLPATVSAGQKKRPIILLNHTDVVTSDASHWSYPPFSGTIDHGVLYGRGAQDMKDEGLAQLVALVMLKREKLPLARDVIFLATADEEASNIGVDWMVRHPELLQNAEYLINEGGENREENGRVLYVGVDTAEKSPYWLHLVAHGEAGHGSRPLADSAPNRLTRALNRVLAWETPLVLVPASEGFLKGRAPLETGQRAAWFRDPRHAMGDPKFRAYVNADPDLAYLFRNTIALTMLGGSAQTNVIPADAWANLDIRLLPGEDPARFHAELKRVINDPAISIQPMGVFFKANSSPVDTLLYRSIERAAGRYFPGALVFPVMTSGYNECQRYRELGIVSYGFTPYASTEAESDTEHGNDERVRVEQVRRAPQVLYDVVAGVATP
jgi:acetylornithine deacetylase/succinyl-diaminopimelate desuccinylase-like protein